MLQTPAKKSVFQRQIPTIIGLIVLVGALIGGVFLIDDGLGVFAPRATPQTTPKNIKITNVTDSGFTISFLTDEATAGFVKYGETEADLQSQSSDDRDQLSGSIGQYQTHHITVRGLKPGTNYFYTLGTGSRASFDDEGKPFQLATAKRAGAPSAAKTAYGSVLTPAGAPADGALVYVAIPGVGEMSSLVKSSGSYAIALSNARTADGSSFAQINDTDTMAVLVQGTSASQVSSFSVTVAESQPIATVTLGQSPDLTAQAQPASDDEGLSRENTDDDPSLTATESADTNTASLDSTNETTATGGSDILSEFNAARSASPSSTTAASANTTSSANSASPSGQVVAVVDLNSTQEQIVTSTMPIIKGTAAPNVVVTIEVHSDTQIKQELIADGNGGFTLDIEKLKTQLEPGEHTATYSYTDPTTGELISKTVTFTVEAPAGSSSTSSTTASSTSTGTGGTSNQLAQTTTSTSPTPTPFGSGNPYSLSSPTATSSATSSGTTATRSGLPATNSAVPVSGSVGTTFALLFGGFFFITAGIWSFWAAREYERVEVDSEIL